MQNCRLQLTLQLGGRYRQHKTALKIPLLRLLLAKVRPAFTFRILISIVLLWLLFTSANMLDLKFSNHQDFRLKLYYNIKYGYLKKGSASLLSILSLPACFGSFY